MSKSPNNRHILHRQVFSDNLSRDPQDHSKAINNKYENLVPHDTDNCFQSDRNPVGYNSESVSSKPIRSNQRRFTDLQQMSISSDDEESIQNSTKCLKNEKQCTIEKLQSMEFGEEYIRNEIELMKHREKRMEYEIVLMKRHEKSIEEVSIGRNSMTDEEKDLKAQIELAKKHEVHVNYEIKRMEHNQIRIKDEIQSIERKIMHMKRYDEKTGETDFRCRQTRDEQQPNTFLHSNCTEELEQLSSELEKYQMRCRDHYDEIEQRKTKRTEYHFKRTECENKLKIINQEEEERIRRTKQLWENFIRQRDNHEQLLARFRTIRSRREIELMEIIATCINNERQSMIDDEKLRDLSIERQHWYTSLSNVITKRHKRSDLHYVDLNREVEYPDHRRNLNMCIPRSYIIHPLLYEPVTLSLNEQPKYDLFISSIDQNDTTIGCLQNALPQWFSTHVKGDISSTNVKLCLDNTSTAVLAIINRRYELSITCQAEMVHIFKRQFPLVLITTEEDFAPSTDWLNIVWRAPNTQKVFLSSSDVKDKLRHAIAAAQWNLMPQMENSEVTPSSTNTRSKRFLGDVHEWTVAYSNPARVSHNYRQLISDPLRIKNDTKLQDIYYNYIRIYFENSDVMRLFEQGASHNNIADFIQAYTWNSSFNSTLNRHLAANVLFFFESILHDTIDYHLVKCLVDFVALLIYRQELSRYLFTGTVYRGVVVSEADRHKYIVGSRIMNTSFLSTSRNREVAEFFSGEEQRESPVLCTYVIHNNNNRRTALDISSMSKFPDEREVLILPFSPFYVKSITRPSKKSEAIEIMLVEDNLDILDNIDLLTISDY